MIDKEPMIVQFSIHPYVRECKGTNTLELAVHFSAVKESTRPKSGNFALYSHALRKADVLQYDAI